MQIVGGTSIQPYEYGRRGSAADYNGILATLKLLETLQQNKEKGEARKERLQLTYENVKKAREAALEQNFQRLVAGQFGETSVKDPTLEPLLAEPRAQLANIVAADPTPPPPEAKSLWQRMFGPKESPYNPQVQINTRDLTPVSESMAKQGRILRENLLDVSRKLGIPEELAVAGINQFKIRNMGDAVAFKKALDDMAKVQQETEASKAGVSNQASRLQIEQEKLRLEQARGQREAEAFGPQQERTAAEIKSAKAKALVDEGLVQARIAEGVANARSSQYGAQIKGDEAAWSSYTQALNADLLRNKALLAQADVNNVPAKAQQLRNQIKLEEQSINKNTFEAQVHSQIAALTPAYNLALKNGDMQGAENIARQTVGLWSQINPGAAIDAAKLGSEQLKLNMDAISKINQNMTEIARTYASDKLTDDQKKQQLTHYVEMDRLLKTQLADFNNQPNASTNVLSVGMVSGKPVVGSSEVPAVSASKLHDFLAVAQTPARTPEEQKQSAEALVQHFSMTHSFFPEGTHPQEYANAIKNNPAYKDVPDAVKENALRIIEIQRKAIESKQPPSFFQSLGDLMGSSGTGVTHPNPYDVYSDRPVVPSTTPTSGPSILNQNPLYSIPQIPLPTPPRSYLENLLPTPPEPTWLSPPSAVEDLTGVTQ